MSRPLIIAALALGAALSIPQLADAAASRHSASTAQRPQLTTEARKGLGFAERRCAACHGITQNSSSPNPEAPPFEDIANRPGVKGSTLQQFLRDAHNYPEAMNFTIDAAEVKAIGEYMITLQKPGYRPIG